MTTSNSTAEIPSLASDLENRGIYLLHRAHRSYVQHKIKTSSCLWAEDVTNITEAKSILKGALMAEGESAADVERYLDVTEPQVIERVTKAFDLYSSQRMSAGLNDVIYFRCCHDRLLKPGANRTTGLSRVIALNIDSKFLTPAIIAHEMGHAGARVTYSVSKNDIAILKVGIARPNEGYYALQLFEEIASMSYVLAAHDQSLIRGQTMAQLFLDRPMSKLMKAVMKIVFEEHDQEGTVAAKEQYGRSWYEQYLSKNKKLGHTKFGFPLPIYRAEGFESDYQSAACSADMLGEEIFSDLPAEQARLAFRKVCIRAQALSDPTPLLALLEKTFGTTYLHFFSALESFDASYDRGLASSILLGLFVQAATKPAPERDVLRAKLNKVATKHIPENPWLMKEYEKGLAKLEAKAKD